LSLKLDIDPFDIPCQITNKQALAISQKCT
jgi:hypothetical protein